MTAYRSYKNQIRNKTIAVLAICFLFYSKSQSQKVDSAYLNYLDQFSQFSTTRVMDANRVREIVRQFAKNELVSNERFAELTKSLYPKNNGIGIILYFYFNDTLSRVFFEPGKVIEEKKIFIRKNDLLQLGDDLNIALRLPQKTANRSPHTRGGEVKRPGKSTPKLHVTVKKLSALLLPESFSKKYSHLIIIPALNIASIPFQLLQPYGDPTYLIEHCRVTIAPTLVDFVGMRSDILRFLGSEATTINDFDEAVAENRIRDPAKVKWITNKSVFVANPKYPTDSSLVYPDLPGAAREVDSALQYVGNPVVFRGEHAIKENILKAMNGSDIVYFATHGVSSNIFTTDDSYLVLSGADPYLRTYEIMSLRMKANYTIPDLVILSACQTGLGATVEAGVAGSLARGFIIGGSHHIVMSLWNVDDDATAFLMNRFLYYVKSSDVFRPSEHLRQAALDTKKRFPDPVYWAAFTYFGVDYD